MSIRSQLEKKIEAQEREIETQKSEILRKEAFLQGLKEALKMLPREDGESSLQTFRPGSDMDKARKYLRSVGHPLYIDEILKGLGKPVNKNTRASLAGSIGNYVRSNQVFTKTAPNTFGLIEFKSERVVEDEPPDDFGIDNDTIKTGEAERDHPIVKHKMSTVK